jgi:hypothetical protein
MRRVIYQARCIELSYNPAVKFQALPTDGPRMVLNTQVDAL